MQNSHLLPNKPCLLSDQLVSHWPCFQHWVSASGDIDWPYIAHTYGRQEVTVADCATRDFSDQKRNTMSLTEAVSRLQNPSPDETFYLPYIKDWHLVLQSRTLSDPADRLPSQTPFIFMDDCMQLDHYLYEGSSSGIIGLNNAPEGQDDFRFCYAGGSTARFWQHRRLPSHYGRHFGPPDASFRQYAHLAAACHCPHMASGHRALWHQPDATSSMFC